MKKKACTRAGFWTAAFVASIRFLQPPKNGKDSVYDSSTLVYGYPRSARSLILSHGLIRSAIQIRKRLPDGTEGIKCYCVYPRKRVDSRTLVCQRKQSCTRQVLLVTKVEVCDSRAHVGQAIKPKAQGQPQYISVTLNPATASRTLHLKLRDVS